ncbi:MAG: ATP-binding protein [Pseudomonadota bacterium]
MPDEHVKPLRFSDTERLHAVLEAAPCSIITTDRRGTVLYANKGVEPMFGYAPDALIGLNISVLMPLDLPGAHDDHVTRHAGQGSSILGLSRSMRGLRADGTTIPLYVTVGTIDHGGIDGYTAIISDQSATEVARSRFAAAINCCSDGFALFDERRRLVLCNHEHRRCFGIDEDLCIPGTTIEHHFSAVEDAARTLLLCDDGLFEEPSKEQKMTLAGGRTLVARQSRLDNGDIILGTRDVTDAHKRDAMLERVERLRSLGELTGGVAHDFNNVLAVIIGNLELLQVRATTTGTAEMVRESLEAAEIGARLTERLLAFARRQPLVVEPVSINDLILDTVPIVKRTLGETVELTLDLARALPTVTIDRGQLEIGLVNLAANARDAMPGGGRLFVETSRADLDGDADIEVPAGSFVRLSVSDTGTGMTPDVRSRVFEPFFTTKVRGGGTGLGLSSLYGYCRQIGGALTVYSEVGKGTTFNLYLPLSEGEDTALVPLDDKIDEMMLAGKTVLVVEDDARVRRMSIKRMTSLGAAVVDAHNGNDALRKASVLPELDLLFTDIVMPGGVDGYALARRLKAERPDLKVLLTSGYAEETANAEELERSGFLLLRKPYRQLDLCQMLQRVLDE